MNILVISRISIPAKDRTLPAWEYLRSLGHTITVEHPDSVPSDVKPDALISMGVTIMDETFRAKERWSDVPLFCFNWDVYEWVWTNPRPGEYDYARYGDLLRLAAEVWVPSGCTGLRTEQWYGLYNWHTILSACPWWDYDDVKDDGYLLCTLREIPDPQWDWFERGCQELDIPYHMTKHECDYTEYQQEVAHCRALVSHCYELSTGGLTLMEGYYHGKPSLLSNSPWHGGKDYMGDRAEYFNYGSFAAFKQKLQQMYESPPVLDRQECRNWVTSNFSDEQMVTQMLERINVHVGV